MLNDSRRMFEIAANRIDGWQTMNKNDIANKYIEYEKDETLREAYFAALMLRYWYNIFKYHKTSKSSRLSIEDYVDWLAESIMRAFKYRAWTKEDNKLYGDPNGPDKVINRCIWSTRNKYYQYYNMDKRKANYISTSLDSAYEETKFEIPDIPDEEYMQESTHNLIQSFIDSYRIDIALILDCLVSFDNELEVDGQLTFSLVKLVKNLKDLDDEYVNYFVSEYNISRDLFESTLSKLKRTNSAELPTIVKKILGELRRTQGVREALHQCC